MPKLKSLQRENFCLNYAKHGNGAKAAIEAGYAEKSARSKASQLLTIINIQQRIQELQQGVQKRTEVTTDRIIQELAILGFSDIRNYMDIQEDTGALRIKAFDEMPEGASRAIQSIQEDRVVRESNNGEQMVVHDKLKFKLWSKINALELLGKRTGAWKEGSISIDNTFNFNMFFENYAKLNGNPNNPESGNSS